MANPSISKLDAIVELCILAEALKMEAKKADGPRPLHRIVNLFLK